MINKSKRGQIDVLFFAITIVAIAIFFLILRHIVGAVNDGLLSSPLNQSEEAVAALNSSNDLIEKFDYIWLTIFVGLILGILISSFLIDVHPVFIPIWIILMGISVLIGVIMNNVYADFVANATLNASADLSPFANFIISHYVSVIIGVGILSMILIFAKTSSGSRRL